MKNTKRLLSVSEFKKYFLVKKAGGVFGKKQYVKANENVTLDIYEGETFALVGESGSGKSTFGKTLLRLQKPTGGTALYYGNVENGNTEKRNDKKGNGEQGGDEKENPNPVDLTKLTNAQMRRLRKDLQIIFQDPYSSLNPRMTVGQIIAEGAITHKFFKRGEKALERYVLDVMEKCGLQAHMLHRYPHQFSGGQRQRVCIARALAVKPRFIVCDECVSALDASIQSQILNLLSKLKEEEKLTYLFISHDLSVVRHVSDRIGVMYLGEIVEIGETEQVFQTPRHPYTIALIAAVPTVETDMETTDREITDREATDREAKTRISKPKSQKILLKGNPPSPVSPPNGCKFHTRCFMAQEICKSCVPPLIEVEKGHFARCHFAEITTAAKRKKAFAQSLHKG